MDKIFSPIKERLMFFIENQNIKKEDFYKKTGITASNFKGAGAKSELGGDKIAKILFNYPEINADWLLMNNGQMMRDNDNLINEPKGIYKKIIKNGLPLVPLTAIPSINDLKDPFLERYEVPLFEKRGAEFLISIADNSMYPKYASGDLLACKLLKDTSFIQWGKYYVLDTEQGTIVKKLFAHSNSDDLLICKSDNESQFPEFSINKKAIAKIAIVVGSLHLE